MKTKYSAEFRLEVVQYQLKGHSKVEAARKFGINPSSAERWLVLYGQNEKDSLDTAEDEEENGLQTSNAEQTTDCQNGNNCDSS